MTFLKKCCGVKLIAAAAFAMLIFSFEGTCLDYVEAHSNLADSFSSLVDPNEGLTSFQSLTIPSGGRDESLALAFTGLADDICFFDYNPAASCVLKNSEVAVFHNSWISDSNIESLAATWRLGDFGFGAKAKCFYVPFTEYNIFGSRVAGGYYSETTGTLNVSYNFFRGYYFKGLAVGANLKGGWRSIPDYTDNVTDAIIEKSGLSQSAAAIMGDLGILLRFNAGKLFSSRDSNLRFGLSLMNAGVSYTGFESARGIVVDDPLPTYLSAGVSYKFIPAVTLTTEFRQPLNFKEFEKSGLWSAGAGVEVEVTEFFEVLAGFRIKGANPRISMGTEFKVRKFVVDLNYTFDLTSSINPINHFSLSARVNLGDQGRKLKEEQVDKLYTAGLDEYAKGNLDAAVSYWESALSIDRGFDPARNWIKAVENSQKLYNRVINMQSLDRK